MDERSAAEYTALRATIRDRGTARMILLPIIFIGWAGTAVAVSTLVPLMVLAAGFEAVFALHVNVERIGRYLEAFHEPDDGWEHVAMAFGRRFPGAGPDPLFSRLFVLAVSVNFLPVALGGDVAELIILAALHLVLINRIRLARIQARTQRAGDLQRFAELRDGTAFRPHDDTTARRHHDTLESKK